MQFIVNRPEVHYAQVLIDANSPEEAFELVFEGDGEDWSTEYVDTLYPEEKPWTVENFNREIVAIINEFPDN